MGKSLASCFFDSVYIAMTAKIYNININVYKLHLSVIRYDMINYCTEPKTKKVEKEKTKNENGCAQKYR